MTCYDEILKIAQANNGIITTITKDEVVFDNKNIGNYIQRKIFTLKKLYLKTIKT